MNETGEWLNKTTENLTATELCLEYGLYNASVNRAYYAMFQSAIAALAKFGISRRGERWNHDYVQAQFSSTLIRRRKVLSSSIRGDLLEVMKRRHLADYSTNQISARVATRMLTVAKNFVQKVKEVVIA